MDNKIAETNLKILFNILPCGSNLVKWKIKDDGCCTICKHQEDILHLIYECIYVERLWKCVKTITGLNIGIREIIFGDNINEEVNMFISLVIFTIYKEWLRYSYDNISRPNKFPRKYYVNEFKWFVQICSKLQVHEECIQYTQQLIEELSE